MIFLTLTLLFMTIVMIYLGIDFHSFWTFDDFMTTSRGIQLHSDFVSDFLLLLRRIFPVLEVNLYYYFLVLGKWGV